MKYPFIALFRANILVVKTIIIIMDIEAMNYYACFEMRSHNTLRNIYTK